MRVSSTKKFLDQRVVFTLYRLFISFSSRTDGSIVIWKQQSKTMAHRCLTGKYKKIKKRLRKEIITSSTITPTKTTRYIDEFLNLKCSPLLVQLQIFPDAKEVSEAMSTFHAYRQFIQPNIPTIQDGRNGKKCIVCVGDGATPRCAR